MKGHSDACVGLERLSIWPHRIEQFIMRHQPSGVIHQTTQDGERLGRQQDAFIASLISVPPQTLVDAVQPKWREIFHRRLYHPPLSSFLPTRQTDSERFFYQNGTAK